MSSLRCASKQTRLLSDLLTTSVRLQDSHCRVDSDNEDTPPPPDGEEELQAWHQGAEQRASFLARLPRLSTLTLDHCPDEGALAVLLSRYGAATSGRVTNLALEGIAAMSAASSCAIRSACPQLTHLDLHFGRRDGEIGGGLHGDVFLPLRDLPLTSLDVSGALSLSTDCLRSLGRVSHLRQLTIAADDIRPHHFRGGCLGGLTNLQHCCIGREDAAALSLLDVHALFTLSRLTHLELPGLDYEGRAAAEEAGGAAAAAAAATQIAAAAAPLSGLVHLQHLSFSSNFVVDDAVFSAVRHLTSLRHLQVGCLLLTHPQPGHLPALQRLLVSRPLRPSALLQTLLPLLPLPSLVSLSQELPADASGVHGFHIYAGCDDSEDAADQAAALKLAAAHLAAAPQLRSLRDVTVVNRARGPDGMVLSVLDIVDGLLPLAGKVCSMSLCGLPTLGAECAALGVAFPAVRTLTLQTCELTDATLAALGARWQALTKVYVYYCTGVSGEGWVGLAAVRADPLRVVYLAERNGVHVSPALPAALVQRCQAVQARVFGRQNITFA